MLKVEHARASLIFPVQSCVEEEGRRTKGEKDGGEKDGGEKEGREGREGNDGKGTKGRKRRKRDRREGNEGTGEKEERKKERKKGKKGLTRVRTTVDAVFCKPVLGCCTWLIEGSGSVQYGISLSCSSYQLPIR